MMRLYCYKQWERESLLLLQVLLGFETTDNDKIQSLQNVISIFDNICTDGHYGVHHGYVARICASRTSI